MKTFLRVFGALLLALFAVYLVSSPVSAQNPVLRVRAANTPIVPQLPILNDITPISGTQGTAVSVTLTGTSFVVAGTTVAVSGTGVTVSGTSVSGSTSLTATFTISGVAAATARNVTVTTSAGTSNATTFTVNASGGSCGGETGFTLYATVPLTGSNKLQELYIDPLDTTSWWAATRLGGVLHSTSSGATGTWSTVTSPGDATRITRTADGLFLSECKTAGGCNSTGSGAGVYRWNGSAFVSSNVTRTADRVTEIIGGTYAGTYVMAQGASGNYDFNKYTGTDTWTPQNSGVIFSGLGQTSACNSNDHGCMISTESSTSFYSTDGGATWLQGGAGAVSNSPHVTWFGSQWIMAASDKVLLYNTGANTFTQTGNGSIPYYTDRTTNSYRASDAIYMTTFNNVNAVYRYTGSGTSTANWSAFHQSDVASLVGVGGTAPNTHRANAVQILNDCDMYVAFETGGQILHAKIR